MKWYNSSVNAENLSGVVISSRIRLARNLEEYPFSPKLSEERKAKMISDVRDAFTKYGTDMYNYVDMSAKTDAEKQCLVEEHLISPDFARAPSSDKRMLVYDENGSVSVMVGEEDHIRIQAVRSGFALENAYESAAKTDEMLQKGLRFAFDEKLGYLTCCPSNTGTGMRASVMLHLPMLTRNNYMKSVIEYCTRLGLTVRGFYGEGSEALGELYQISNQITLGISEEDTLQRLSEAVNKIAGKENSLREKIKNDKDAEDKLWRSYGILTNARKLSTNEFLGFWSDVMLGVNTGIVEAAKGKNFLQLLVESMPAHVARSSEAAKDPEVRDALRADRIRSFFAA